MANNVFLINIHVGKMRNLYHASASACHLWSVLIMKVSEGENTRSLKAIGFFSLKMYEKVMVNY